MPGEQAPPQIVAPAGPAKEAVREQDKIMLVLAYLSILALIPLLTVKDSPYVKWHAKNGLVLGIGAFAVALVTGMIPFLGCVVVPLLTVGVLVLTIMGIIKALNGERWRIPLVSDLAEKF